MWICVRFCRQSEHLVRWPPYSVQTARERPGLHHTAKVGAVLGIIPVPRTALPSHPLRILPAYLLRARHTAVAILGRKVLICECRTTDGRNATPGRAVRARASPPLRNAGRFTERIVRSILLCAD